MRRVLVTGAAGFIGFHLCKRLMEDGHTVIGIDNLNDYYDVSLKESRLKQLKPYENFRFIKLDIADRNGIAHLFESEHIDYVVNLAAQAGVRYSLDNPYSYIDSNLVGFANILEGCRHNGIKHLVYASSSSVYGSNSKIPFSVHDAVDHPRSLYAATKKTNELMAHAYSHLYALPTTGLRFFTVYGPWGRPDMAYYIFTKAILERKPVSLFNHGKHRRDFTYIDDIIDGIIAVIDKPASPNKEWDSMYPDAASSHAPWRIYNIGNNNPISLEKFISVLEDILGRKAEKVLLSIQPGDVEETFADINDLTKYVGYRPKTPIVSGLERFVAWYREYYQV